MLPQVELTAGYNHTHTSEQNAAANSAGIDTDNHGMNVGVQVTMPLFAGGALNSQRKQAALLSEAADASYKAAYRDTGQAARTQYRLVQTDAESIKAGAQAIKSAQTALEATEEGYKVGTSTIIDVLNAESLLYSARSNYANARYDYIIDSLALKATAGVLSEKDLTEVNGWLDGNNPISLDLAQADASGKP
jgi:outer membrane protein